MARTSLVVSDTGISSTLLATSVTARHTHSEDKPCILVSGVSNVEFGRCWLNPMLRNPSCDNSLDCCSLGKQLWAPLEAHLALVSARCGPNTVGFFRTAGPQFRTFMQAF